MKEKAVWNGREKVYSILLQTCTLYIFKRDGVDQGFNMGEEEGGGSITIYL